MFVARHILGEALTRPDSGAMASYVLTPLSPEGVSVRFDAFSSEREMRTRGGDAYERLVEVRGSWSERPLYAVFAEWWSADAARYAAFEESRSLLFEVRRQNLATFAFDWPLRNLDLEGRYVVLGLYGDEEGATRLCREHPAVRRFAAEHPAGDYAATDLTGLRVFRVESAL